MAFIEPYNKQIDCYSPQWVYAFGADRIRDNAKEIAIDRQKEKGAAGLDAT
jgi:hypothetical protein